MARTRFRRASESSDLAARGVGRGAAAVAGIAALRHHADAVLVAVGEHARDGCGIRGRHDGQRNGRDTARDGRAA